MRADTYKIHGIATNTYVFDSVAELLDEVAQVPQSRVDEPGISVNCPSFIGRQFATWDDVHRAARTAWTWGLSIVDRMLAEIGDTDLPRPTSRRRRMRFREDDGDELDFDRLRSGQPYWRTSRREHTQGPATITILVDVGANCDVRHTDILWRGAAAIALTQRLEEAGYRVELWSVHRSNQVWSDSNGQAIDGFHAVCLKRPGDPLDPSTLIASVSGWFFRTVMFRAACLGNLNIHRHLGQHRLPRTEDLDHITRDTHRILIAEAFSYEDAVAKIRQVLSTLTN